MEFNEKLQELRRAKGITQQELAHSIYVSRTAVSKWESGKGYPGIESLKAIAAYFSVTVDHLLSSEEALTMAQKDGERREGTIRDTVFGLVDVSHVLLLFLPFFAQRIGEAVQSVSLMELGGIATYMKVLYFVFVIGTACMGVLTLSLQNLSSAIWVRNKWVVSISFSVACGLLFVLSLQPYAAVFTLFLLFIKVFMLVKCG